MNLKRSTIKSISRWIPLLAAVWLCGCFQVQDELTLRPDGSGTVKLILRTSLSEELVDKLTTLRDGGSGAPMYPPASEEEARRLFPAKDFALSVEQQSNDDGATLSIVATFKNVNGLLASPYANAHQLVLKTNTNGELTLQALSGGSSLVTAAQLKTEGELAEAELPGIEEARARKNLMRLQFRVVLPNRITVANRPHDNDSVTWTLDRATCKNDSEFAVEMAGQLEATCSAKGIRFSAMTPPRLGLVPFNRLQAGKVAETSAGMDTNQVVAAARFEPYVVHLTRTRDLRLAGSEGNGEAELIGAILLPAAFTPYRWGQFKLEEAVDGKGNNLIPSEAATRAWRSPLENFRVIAEPEADDETPSVVKDKPHLLALLFKAPPWRTKEISRIKGHVSLEYLGEAEVIKLNQAVPASLVMDSNGPTSPNDIPDSQRLPVANRRLAELGLTLRVAAATIQGGMTALELEATGAGATLLDAQLFDVEGNPWPTSLSKPDVAREDNGSYQLRVVGKPSPPFSLALTVAKAGPSLAIPIFIEHILESAQNFETSQAGPYESTAGFRAEPFKVTISALHYFPPGEEYFKKRPATWLFGPRSIGTMISARLYAPQSRLIRNVTGMRVTAAKDDQGHAIAIVPEATSPIATPHQSIASGTDDSDNSGGFPVELQLGVPAPDAKAIEALTAEATVLSIGGWKEIGLTNVHADLAATIDLGKILPGATLVIKKVDSGKRERTVQANLAGPREINQLNFKIILSGPRSAQSRTSELRTRRGRNPGKTTRNIIVHGSEPQMGEEARSGPVTLLVRFPQDIKRERVQFKLDSFGLL
jgi:hypothetical protein